MGQRRTKVNVMGGMGPQTTIDFYEKIIATTGTGPDQDRMHLLIEFSLSAA